MPSGRFDGGRVPAGDPAPGRVVGLAPREAGTAPAWRAGGRRAEVPDVGWAGPVRCRAPPTACAGDCGRADLPWAGGTDGGAPLGVDVCVRESAPRARPVSEAPTGRAGGAGGGVPGRDGGVGAERDDWRLIRGSAESGTSGASGSTGRPVDRPVPSDPTAIASFALGGRPARPVWGVKLGGLVRPEGDSS
ncbi:hypothetical protein GCM10010488_08620 [Oerskovia jenensis]